MAGNAEAELTAFPEQAVECWRRRRPHTDIPALRSTFSARIRLAHREKSTDQIMTDLRRSMRACAVTPPG